MRQLRKTDMPKAAANIKGYASPCDNVTIHGWIGSEQHNRTIQVPAKYVPAEMKCKGRRNATEVTAWRVHYVRSISKAVQRTVLAQTRPENGGKFGPKEPSFWRDTLAPEKNKSGNP